MAPEPRFGTLRFSQVSTEEARRLILREQPAVYAWYRRLDVHAHVDSQERFVQRVLDLVTAKLSCRFRGKLGYLYALEVQECAAPLSERRIELLAALAKSAAFRHGLAELLDAATFLQAPLYIGKAVNLRRRIGQHVRGSTDLRAQLESAGIPMTECILRHCYFSDDTVGRLLDVQDADADEAMVVLIEELLTRLGPAAFVRRPG